MEVCFSGSGWLLYYQLGVAHVLQETGYTRRCVRFSGTSGGALVSLFLTLDYPIAKLQDFYLNYVPDDYHSNDLVNVFRVKKYLSTVLRNPDLDPYYKAAAPLLKQGRFAATVTTLGDLQSHLEYSYNSKEEAIQAVLASAAIFPLGGLPFKYHKEDALIHNKLIYDGGFLNMMPRTSQYSTPDDTLAKSITESLLVSGFSQFEADIKPSRTLPIWWCVLPGSKRQLKKVFELGIKDAINYFSSKDLLDLKAEHKIWENLRKYYVDEEDKIMDLRLEEVSVASSQSFPSKGSSDSVKSVQTEEPGILSSVWRAASVGTVYAEKTAILGLVVGKLGASIVEKKRRSFVQRSLPGFTSFRLWVPDSVLSFTPEEQERDVEEIKQRKDELVDLVWNWRNVWSESKVRSLEGLKNSVLRSELLRSVYPSEEFQ
eukprot:augustus_masked-scaffold_18-processed-gene-1.55-mRNA-1 protein AED:0.06 eAED:1.00 QI:0/-1/0/1/-1/1/1/0/428